LIVGEYIVAAPSFISTVDLYSIEKIYIRTIVKAFIVLYPVGISLDVQPTVRTVFTGDTRRIKFVVCDQAIRSTFFDVDAFGCDVWADCVMHHGIGIRGIGLAVRVFSPIAVCGSDVYAFAVTGPFEAGIGNRAMLY